MSNPTHTPTIELYQFPWCFKAQSSRDSTKYYLVNLSANNLKGSCDCLWSRVTKTDCRHLRKSRELWWLVVAPSIRRIE